MFEVILSPEAQVFYAAAASPLAKRLARCFEHLEQDPRTGNTIKRLSGNLKGYSRYRVGDWRVIFRIDDATKQVFVVTIAHRGEVYE